MSEKRVILCKLNVSKIEKHRLFKGEKGTYLDCALVPSDNNQYGDDFMIVQSVSKEEREAGKRGAIIGNAKFIKKAAAPASAPVADGPPEQDDIPF